MQEMHKKLVKKQQNAKEDYNVNSRDLPKFRIGDRVRIQDHVSRKFSIRGTIEEVLGEREYLVKQDQGGKLKRNRRFLILDKSFQDVTADLNPARLHQKKLLRFKEPIEEHQEQRKSSRKTKKPNKYTK